MRLFVFTTMCALITAAPALAAVLSQTPNAAQPCTPLISTGPTTVGPATIPPVVVAPVCAPALPAVPQSPTIPSALLLDQNGALRVNITNATRLQVEGSLGITTMPPLAGSFSTDVRTMPPLTGSFGADIKSMPALNIATMPAEQVQFPSSMNVTVTSPVSVSVQGYVTTTEAPKQTTFFSGSWSEKDTNPNDIPCCACPGPAQMVFAYANYTVPVGQTLYMTDILYVGGSLTGVSFSGATLFITGSGASADAISLRTPIAVGGGQIVSFGSADGGGVCVSRSGTAAFSGYLV